MNKADEIKVRFKLQIDSTTGNLPNEIIEISMNDNQLSMKLIKNQVQYLLIDLYKLQCLPCNYGFISHTLSNYPVIPGRVNRKIAREYDQELYKECNLILLEI